MNYNSEDLKKIIKLGKPQFTFGISMYFLVGAGFALLLGAPFVLSKFFWGYIILFMASLAIHYANDYFDFDLDHYDTPTTFTGGSGILVENPYPKEISKRLAIFFISISITIGAIFTVVYNFPLSFFLFVLLGNFMIWFYSAPPVKFSYRRMGEIANLINGFIIPATGYFVMMGTINLPFVIFSIPLLLLQLVFTIGVEIPDFEGDKLGGKITWIVSKGREFGFKLIGITAILVTASFLIIPYSNLLPQIIDFRIVAVISLVPLSLGLIGFFKKPVDKEPATKLSTLTVASAFSVLIMINCYFVYIITV